MDPHESIAVQHIDQFIHNQQRNT